LQKRKEVISRLNAYTNSFDRFHPVLRDRKVSGSAFSWLK